MTLFYTYPRCRDHRETSTPMFIGATDSLFEALGARRRVNSGEGGCDGGEGASSVRSVREVQRDHWSGCGLFLVVLAEFKRAVAAAQRYAELKRVGAATLTRDGIAPADIPRRISRALLMFLPDVPGTLMRLRSFLKAGGRLAASVWGDKSKVQFAAAGSIIAGELGLPPPPPGLPGVFALVDQRRLEMLVREAGFQDVRPVPCR
jgi:hypothetical protein